MTEPVGRENASAPSSPTPPTSPIGAPATMGHASPTSGPPSGYATESDRSWALIAHFGATALVVLTVGVLAWVPGMIVIAVKGRSQVLRAHGTESANFQCSWGVATVTNLVLGLCSNLMCFSVIFYVFTAISASFAFAFSIVGGVKASQGLVYRYPLSFRLFR